MTTKTRNLSIAAGAVAVLLLFILKMAPSDAAQDAPRPSLPPTEMEVDLPTPAATPLAAPDPQAKPNDHQHDRTYSIGLHEIRGLNEATAPGTRIDIWAAWGPPIAKKPRVGRLVKDVTVVELQPPLLPEGPVTLVLGLDNDQIQPFTWGVQYANLAAVAIQ